MIAGCNILSNSTSNNRNRSDFDKNSSPNLTEIVPIMNMIPVGTPGLVADVGNADTPQASSHSKTPRKGAKREAHFHKFKRTAYKVLEIILDFKMMENENDFKGLEKQMDFLLECRKKENDFLLERVRESEEDVHESEGYVRQFKETFRQSKETLKYLSELIEKHKQVHKERLGDVTQILVDEKKS